MKKKIKHLIEAFFLWLVFLISSVMGYKLASNFGGFLGRAIGVRMGASKKARKNLCYAFPEKSEEEINTIIKGMWDNLGRTIFEYSHLKNIMKHNVITPHNIKSLRDAQKKNKPVLMLGAHIGNWEVLPFLINTDRTRKVSSVYRAPNNPWADKILTRIRSKAGGKQIRKGSQGAKEIVRLLKDGEDVGLLFDQKMNEGLPIPFFGRLAMTLTSAAQLGLKYDCTIIPVYCIRKNKTEFDAYFCDAFELTRTGNLVKDTETNMQRMNQMLEEWILKAPEQWLWLHRRWPENPSQLKNKKEKKQG